ncbi:unnamed protein product [Rotaria socialis]|uniref:Sugar phosphate transporter domain-containing protein n=1 Tax=Rotaria socialis TaxID=392032 RepID=A0A818MZD7_9BILA|nr:unnamed protein product [Rotaria socialis]CAF4603544.1 unnamed protein product [Rotaria socialis]
MALATVTNGQLNWLGTVVGIIAVITTTQLQLSQGKKQHDYDLSAMQINHAQALPTFFVCLTLALLLESNTFFRHTTILAHKWTVLEAKWISLSAILAASVNLCCYGLIRNTSALTYQVTGHAKTALIFVGGYFLSGGQAPVKWSNFIGAAICLGGSVLYGYVRYIEENALRAFQIFTTGIQEKFFGLFYIHKKPQAEPLASCPNV